jgi:uncharacterized protein (TIGR00296 family)
MEKSETLGASTGAAAVARARRALEAAVRGGSGRDPVRTLSSDPVPDELRDPRGVFVTLQTYPKGRLRGCIGFPLPVFPLHVAIARAAAAAALEDPRFPPVGPQELEGLTVEVSILSVPVRLEGPPLERPSKIVIGRDGLIADSGDSSGLLLPQVAPEQGWDAVEFLEGVCEKADLPKHAWRNASTRILQFHADVFRETVPGGVAIRSPSIPRDGET